MTAYQNAKGFRKREVQNEFSSGAVRKLLLHRGVCLVFLKLYLVRTAESSVFLQLLGHQTRAMCRTVRSEDRAETEAAILPLLMNRQIFPEHPDKSLDGLES